MDWIRYPGRDSWRDLLKRPEKDLPSLEAVVSDVFNRVASEGDAALKAFTERFDGVVVEDLRLTPEEIERAGGQVPQDLKDAIDLAYENIYAFHAAQKTGRVEVFPRPGVHCWQEKHPIERVGLYIPGGTAPLFSTVLMLAIPARLAGCQEVVLCSPPGRDGNLHPAIVYAASRCGVSTICKVGGIQAIAALTLGTESVPPVYKLFGPGNQYVTQAKQWAGRWGVSMDMPAGPSEVLVVADHTAVPQFVAADLLSQAEHGADSQVVLLTDREEIMEAVNQALEAQLDDLPRQEIARQAITHSRGIVLKNWEEIADMVNLYAPEHLIICHREERFLLEQVHNAGSVFLGNYTPESAGDYASGTNHTLPTNGYARQYSGVNLDSFLKSITYQRLDAEGLREIGPSIEVMAEAEGLRGHARAVGIRREYLERGLTNAITKP
ncbi:histidinol dehydrogenase [Robiginitalea marina]|uniref:Histidinol dehydrogenase n=1 Tax=Robiginitalea marina TaxID=2954105 RepID=A0ABT1AV67_9FLAO|nr:histidinol dehydrogenase [Robiginitalea marina]MCO5723569.1 histidinol dehydrogenase [Robiginitalea marina]